MNSNLYDCMIVCLYVCMFVCLKVGYYEYDGYVLDRKRVLELLYTIVHEPSGLP